MFHADHFLSKVIEELIQIVPSTKEFTPTLLV